MHLLLFLLAASDDVYLRAIDPSVLRGRHLATTDSLGISKQVVLLVVTSDKPLEDNGVSYFAGTTATLHLLTKKGGKWSAERLAYESSLAGGTLATSLTQYDRLAPGVAGFSVSVGRQSDGEGQHFDDAMFVLVAGKATKLFQERYEPSSGSGYPHQSDAFSITTEGPADAKIVKMSLEKERCADAEGECDVSKTEARFCWNGEAMTEFEQLISASASSTLAEGKKKIAHSADFAVDDAHETAWVEGAKGSGKGEWINLELACVRKLTALRIVTGYAKNEKVWRENARPKQVIITASDKTQVKHTLRDTIEPQTVPFVTGSVQSLKIEIVDVYAGSKFEDAAFSSIELD